MRHLYIHTDEVAHTSESLAKMTKEKKALEAKYSELEVRYSVEQFLWGVLSRVMRRSCMVECPPCRCAAVPNAQESVHGLIPWHCC